MQRKTAHGHRNLRRSEDTSFRVNISLLKAVARSVEVQWAGRILAQTNMPNSLLAFDLSMAPNPRFVSVVRRFVEEAFEKLVASPDEVFRIAMTAHELLENAAKYSNGAKAVLRLSLDAGNPDGRVTVSPINETTPLHIERLRQLLERLNAAPDPMIHYQQLMRENARKDEESGLGLARIAAEGEMTMGLEITGATVAVIASGQVSTRELS